MKRKGSFTYATEEFSTECVSGSAHAHRPTKPGTFGTYPAAKASKLDPIEGCDTNKSPLARGSKWIRSRKG